MTSPMLTELHSLGDPHLSPDRMMVAWTRALEERDQRGWSGRDLGGEVHRAG